MLLTSGIGPEILDGPRINWSRPVIEAARHSNPESAPEQGKHDCESRSAGPQDQPRNQRIGQIKEPLCADRPRDRRATADGADEGISVNQGVNPAVDRKHEIGKRTQNAAESLRVTIQQIESPAAED